MLNEAQRLRAQVGRKQRDVFHPAGLYVKNGPRITYPHLSRPRILRDGLGVRWQLDLGGVAFEAFQERAPRIAQAADALPGCTAVVAEPEPDPDHASKAWLTIWAIDPLRVTVPHPGWPSKRSTLNHYVAERDLMRGAPVGVRRNGSIARAPLVETHRLIVGQTGYGKSQLARNEFVHLRAVNALPEPHRLPVAHIHCDFKEGVELPFTAAGCAAQTSDVHEAAELINAVWGEMRRRQRSLRHRGVNKLTPAMATPDEPLIHVMIDEGADYWEPWLSPHAGEDERKAERERLAIRSAVFDNLARKARNVNIILTLMIQKPLAKTLPSRPHFAWTGATRTENLAHTMVAFGSVDRTQKERPDLLPAHPDSRGRTFDEAEGGALGQFKGFFVDDTMCSTAAELGPNVPLPFLESGRTIDISEALEDELGPPALDRPEPSDTGRRRSPTAPAGSDDNPNRKRRTRRGRRSKKGNGGDGIAA